MNIANLLELQACNEPDKKAVVFGGDQYSCGFMNAQANRVAKARMSMGITKGTVSPCGSRTALSF